MLAAAAIHMAVFKHSLAAPPTCSYVTSDDPQTLRWAELSTCASEKPLLTL